MSNNFKKTIVFGLSQGIHISEDLIKYSKGFLYKGEVNYKKFNDGEILVSPVNSVRNCHTFVVQSIIGTKENSVNDSLLELLIFIDALKRANARTINLIIPYFGYARQDRKINSHEPISAKLVSNLLVKAGATRVTVYDIHAPQIQGFFDIPFDNLTAIQMFATYIMKKYKSKRNNFIVISQDIGASVISRKLAKLLNCDVVSFDKQRVSESSIAVKSVFGNLNNKFPIVVDDMIATGTTLLSTLGYIKKNFSINNVVVCATHGLFTKGIEKFINSDFISELVITNTIAANENYKYKKLTVLKINKFILGIISAWLNSEPLGAVYTKFYS